MKLDDLATARLPILALRNVSEKEMEENVDILRIWMEKEPNIPSDLIQDAFLEINMINNKFSIEKTKRKIEQYCTLKALERYKYLYERFPVPSEQNGFYMMIPQLTEDFHRVFIGKIRDENKYIHSEDVSNFLLMSEISAHFDYNAGEIYVMDLTNCSTHLLSKFRVNIAMDCIKIFFEGMSGRMKGFHVINKHAKIIMSLFMPLLPKKMTTRMHFHDGHESLKDFVSTKYLPRDFGGELKSFDEMLLDWDKIYAENCEVIKGIRDIKARGEIRNSHYQELDGTFKKLNID